MDVTSKLPDDQRKWVRWYPDKILSDRDYQALPYRFRAVYRELLDEIALKGRATWDPEMIRIQFERFDCWNEGDERWLKRLKLMFKSSKTKSGDSEHVTHAFMLEQASKVEKWRKQRTEAAKSRWTKEKSGSDRNAVAPESHSARNATVSNSNSSSLSLSKEETNRSDPEKPKALPPDEARGVEWVTSLSVQDQDLLKRAFVQAGRLRKGRKMSLGIANRTLFSLSKFSLSSVREGTTVYLDKWEGKDEKYWVAIVRRKDKGESLF